MEILMLDSETVQIGTEMGNLFVTIGFNKTGLIVKIILNIAKNGSQSASFAEAIARLTTLSINNGVPLKLVIKELKDIGGKLDPPTVPDALAIVLYDYEKRGRKKSGESKRRIDEEDTNV